MRKLTVFNSVSLDGYFTGENGDLGWAHKRQDKEWTDFVSSNASGGDTEMLFGRVTYDLMKSYWPTPAASEQMPEVADRMNTASKVAFSRTVTESDWQNTRFFNGDIAEEVRRMKSEDGPDMIIMGSGSIIQQLTDARLIDEYQFVVTPIVLGKGRTMFEGVKEPLDLKRTSVREFENGNVLTNYEAA
jgi:dihydrofolate reductase